LLVRSKLLHPDFLLRCNGKTNNDRTEFGGSCSSLVSASLIGRVQRILSLLFPPLKISRHFWPKGRYFVQDECKTKIQPTVWKRFNEFIWDIHISYVKLNLAQTLLFDCVRNTAAILMRSSLIWLRGNDANITTVKRFKQSQNKFH
jgi:hypothetical protein